jgi:RNA polymerase sigma-70 factor (ECF subfamily)
LRRHYDRIHAICRRLAGNAADADDATQEALLALVRGLPKFDGRAKFTTWLYRVTTNACLDELRRRGRRPVPTDDQIGAAQPAAGPAVDAAVAGRMEIDAALGTLSPEFRAPIVLRDLCQLDYAEIAEALDVPPGTVRSRIARGRAALARHLAGNQEGTDERRTHATDHQATEHPSP